MSLIARRAAGVVAALLISVSTASADEIRVLMSRAFMPAYLELIRAFESTSTHTVTTAFGASMGDAADSVPNRLRRGTSVDVLIVAGSTLDELIAQGKVMAGSRVDLARSGIGVAVRAGAAEPDISTVDALRRTLLAAKSIAYSNSASGIYVSKELFQRLGIADRVHGKSRRIDREQVGSVVARGDAEIGFQQISELLPVPGIRYLGPLPAEVQRVTVFSAGVATGARAPDAARALIAFLASPGAAPAIISAGLEPMSSR